MLSSLSFSVLVAAVLGISPRLVSTPPLESMSPPQLVGEERLDAAIGSQKEARIASDGNGYFIVWEDERSPRGIVGSRVSASGEVLEPHGIRIAKGGGNHDVIWNGSVYIALSSGWIATALTRISPAGEFVGEQHYVGWAQEGWPITSRIAWNGTHYLVVAVNRNEADSSRKLHGVLLDPQFQVVSPTFAFPQSLQQQDRPEIATDGKDFVVVWEESSPGETAAFSMRVSGAGLPDLTSIHRLDTILAPRLFLDPDVAWTGGAYLVVWSHDDLYSQTLDSAGAPSGPVRAVVDRQDFVTREPSIDSLGGETVIAWGEGSRYPEHVGALPVDIWAVSVTSQGAPSAEPIRVTEDRHPQESPAVSVAATGAFVTWTDTRYREFDIFGAVLGDTSAGPEFVVSQSLPHQRGVVESNGDDFLVVWAERDHGRFKLLASRWGADGALLDEEPITLPAMLETEPPFLSAASNGSVYLVVWSETPALYPWLSRLVGARVANDGSVLDGEPFLIAELGSEAEVASDGLAFVVVWRSGRPGDGYGEFIRATEVGADGLVRVRDGALLLRTDAISQNGPKIVWNGSEYLVLWSERRPAAQDEIKGVFVDRAGIPRPENPVRFGFRIYPYRLASGGTHHLLLSFYRNPPFRVTLIERSGSANEFAEWIGLYSLYLSGGGVADLIWIPSVGAYMAGPGQLAANRNDRTALLMLSDVDSSPETPPISRLRIRFFNPGRLRSVRR